MMNQVQDIRNQLSADLPKQHLDRLIKDTEKLHPIEFPQKLNSSDNVKLLSLQEQSAKLSGATSTTGSLLTTIYPYFPPLYLIEGTPKSDLLFDTRNNDLILARGGNDWIIAWRGGDDHIYGESGDDFIYAGAGNDRMYGGSGNDRMYGGSGNDYMYGDSSYYYYYPYATLDSASQDTLAPATDSSISYPYPYPYPSGGNDYMYGGIGRDYMYGGGGHDIMYGGSDNDVIYGDSGNNYYPYFSLSIWYPYPYPAGGNDKLSGGKGNDYIYGEGGNDKLNGGDGDDYLEGGSGNDYIYGGNGNDTIVGSNQRYYWRYFDTSISVNKDISLQADVAHERTVATASVNSDSLTIAPDMITDRPIIYSDQDTLTGGQGKDKFVFYNRYGGVDTITDFHSGQDQIQVSRYSFGGGLTAGMLKEEQFILGSSAQDADDRFIYNHKTGDLFFDADGTGSQAQLQFAKLSGAPALQFSDIHII